MGCHSNRVISLVRPLTPRVVIGLPLNEGRQIVVGVLGNENESWRLGQVLETEEA